MRLTRRQFIAAGSRAITGAALGLGSQSSVARVARARDQELTSASLQTIARLIRSRQVSSVEVVQACADRIEAVNPWLNAVVTWDTDRALDQAREADAALKSGRPRGPLHGVPMTIKDSFDTRDMASSWGVAGRDDFVPAADATIVARLRAAGAILLGKTNTPELTLSFETNSPAHGATNNPYDIERTAGGSSGGAAAIVAAGGVPFDIGSDTGGSVRVPAHCCGVAGIRPMSGRVPRTGNAIPPGGVLDRLCAVGPITRYVDDLAILMGIIAGPDAHDPSTIPMPAIDYRQVQLKGMRGTFHSDNGIRAPDQDTVNAVRSAVVALADAGVQLTSATPPGVERSLDIFQRLFNWDRGAWRRYLLARALGSTHQRSNDDLSTVSAKDFLDLIADWDEFRARMSGFMESYDLMICPVNAFAALPHGKTADNIDAFSYTMSYSLTDWPAVVVRAGTSPDGLPIGVQIVAPPWREDIALAAAAHIESVTGGWRPPRL